MQIYLRLDEILRLDTRPPREIKKLAKQMGLSKYKLELLAKNKWRAIKQDVLSKVCDYLLEKGLVDAADLPGILFARAPNEFWQLLRGREQVITCMGYRFDEYRDSVVIAADSQLQANLLYCMTQAAAHAEDVSETRRRGDHRTRRMPQIIDPRLVPTWDRKQRDKDPGVIAQTCEFYEEFVSKDREKALVCFGSVKSNPVIERVIAAAFPRATPFQSQDDVPLPQDRACPFVFVYRTSDPRPMSVCGGEKHSQGHTAYEPGIHYAQMVGDRETWCYAPWSDEESDAALVFYRFHRSIGQFEIVLGGFSGRGTKFLAKYIREHKEMLEFWPPTISSEDVDLGVFIVRFVAKTPAVKGVPQASPDYKEYPQVIRLDKAVLERRMVA